MYIGLDVHKKRSFYAMVDETGEEKERFTMTYEGLDEFAKKHVKTDKVDAEVLAQLLRLDYLPRHHASLIRVRTSIKNRVHALLAIEGIQTSEFNDLFGKRGMEFRGRVKLRRENEDNG
ncbi:MAG: hypothetical protein N2V78_11020 [Methanophagales archaeon]|nr:hypothetical protein [Methanophagales archaeon]